MEINLYDNDLAAPEFRGNIIDKVQGLKFSTKLHGGFSTCSFKLKADLPEAWDWLTSKTFYRIVIKDVTKTLFEGRIQDIELSYGSAGATAYGYYASLRDDVYNTAYNAFASVVIKAILTAVCPSISADQTNIDATDIAITSAADDSYLDITPQALVEKLLAFSDTTSKKWYFAIWEDRIPYLKARSISSLTWQVRIEDLARFKLKHRAGDMWNSCYAVYDAAGLVRTADSDDTISQTKYNLKRRHVVPQLGTVAAATAQSQRDIWLAEHKDIWPSLEDFVLGDMVFDTSMVPYPSSWVRSGDAIRVIDLVPASGDLDAVTRDALRTFYILETQYDANSRQNRIIVDTENMGLTSILARKL